MSDTLSQFLTGVETLASHSPSPSPSRRKGTGGRGCDMPVIPVTNTAQIVLPTRAWDWQTATKNSTSFAQFQFADMIPQSVASGQEYTASSDSFSSNYRMFLDMIPAGSFPSADALKTAKAGISVPSATPISDPPPAGWTKVKRSGTKRWAPAWDLSISSTDWFNKVQSQEIVNPGSFTIDLAEGDDRNALLTASNRAGLLPAPSQNGADFESITISADCWGQISIVPGTWFNSAIIRMGKPLLKDKDMFFGPNGLLRGRVSSFFVAYRVSFKINSSSPISTAVKQQLSAAKDPQIAGQAVSGPSINASNKTVTYKSINQGASIVAAIIETF